ncbi:MAG: DUF1214 domain-containing protein [Candidatus Binatia bacterium]|nr:DUF1214 domain-containing protein [Candidatus Binatia bacterium]
MIESKSRTALHGLIDSLTEIDQRFLSEEWMMGSAEDVAEATRAAMHLLQCGLVGWFEEDPEHPSFRRIVTPTRKFMGDNADAVYYEAPIRPGLRYRVRGNISGAVYVSLTIEGGSSDGTFGGQTCGVINDTEFDTAADGSFEIYFGGEKRDRNWLPIAPEGHRLTTRHYFEEEECRAASTIPGVELAIEVLDKVGPPAPYNDESVAAGLDKVRNLLHSRTLGMGVPGTRDQPPFVSSTPNEFVQPIKPGQFALAAADAAYSMSMCMLQPDEALVMTGRWPDCRCANISLWNRHMQTFDYANRGVSLNRKQTKLEDDGSFRMIIAHQDPGVSNWIDTEGRGFSMVFWRFMLPSGEIETPQAKVVPFAEIAAK